MVKLKIINDKDRSNTKDLVKLAILKETKRLEISIEKSNKRIKGFEKKYNISSEYFLKNYTAEDLDGRDKEYIRWYGEIQLKNRILPDLNKLKEIEYESK